MLLIPLAFESALMIVVSSNGESLYENLLFVRVTVIDPMLLRVINMSPFPYVKLAFLIMLVSAKNDFKFIPQITPPERLYKLPIEYMPVTMLFENTKFAKFYEVSLNAIIPPNDSC